ncbi:SDR family NAD(P)-dependent oxidoreductase [Georgenia sp. TF02-10]|uniref:SDR family NAD(P)-dependent oxidoreductase n=1 Tax=Georgenia sp. TF02-10 TaxID=2917725 RepID=UPI001FA6AE85|nr:SDR family NAD(P)-dependent oxidoreductase [Georgenia sp. TF02-10]UNX55359.1 SDR family NAD(P)-dependent oxidoreductase [Georgenia sp. TF02-10]
MPQRTILITGASDGIGAVAAAELAARGDRVLAVGRSPEKTARVAERIGVEHFACDFARLDDVRALAAEVRARTDRLDVLANNAGGIFGERTMTPDGHEQTLQVNHLAPFLLTTLLLDRLRAGDGLVVNTSSVASRLFAHLDLDDLGNARRYTPQKAYGDAKLANILFTKGLHAHHHDEGIDTVAIHPGNVATNFAAETSSPLRFIYHTPLRRLVLISPEKGAANLTWAIDGEPGRTWVPGEYYEQLKVPRRVNPQQDDPELVEAFWRRSAELVGVAA